MSTAEKKEDALYAILCGQERWLFKDHDFYSIIFHDDGTGEVCPHATALLLTSRP
jgi:hypothetical protein